mmetsp:Transcript_67898/g.209953  ORF Transcript_67898/g.209953 Transcript_67898/m.209953 type:complete len:234 (-) Transcript_67898:160-861(-)
MQAHHVVDENVATPGGCCGGVGQAGEHPEGPGPGRPDGAAPEPEDQREGAHGDRLVVEAAGDGSHDVRGYDGHDEGGGHARAGALGDLDREEEEEERGEAPEPGRHHAAHVVQAHGPEVQRLAAVWQLRDNHLGEVGEDLRRVRDLRLRYHLQRSPDHDRGDLHPWVDGRADWPSDRVPTHIVVPPEELVPALLRQVHGCPEVEPRVELVDDVAVLLDRLQSDPVCPEAEVGD